MGAFISFLFGVRPSTLWFPDSPAYIDVRPPSKRAANGIVNGTANGHAENGTTDKQKLSIRAFVEEHVPALKEPFRPTWWLPGGHLQTVYCVIGDFTKVNPIHYTRKLLTFPDSGSIAMDIAGSPSLPPETPTVVVCHGLAGGSHESYVRDVLAEVVGPKEEGGLGWRGVVCNFRGCGGSRLTNSQLYSAGNTHDLRTALLYLSTRFPGSPMVGVGFSLGACVLTRYLGEEGEASRLRAGIVLGCPWDLVANSKRLEENVFIRNTYSRAMGSNLAKIVQHHLPQILAYPRGKAVEEDIKTLFSLRAPTLKTVDTYVTRHLGGPSPPFPFPTADAYYTWASCHHHPPKIRVPFLALNADDDPIIMGNHLPIEDVKASEWCVLGVTRGGGHLGWFEGGGSPPRRWVRTPILQYLRATVDSYVPPPGRSTPGWEKKDGFIREVGREEVAFREEEGEEGVEGADEVDGQGVMAGL